MLSHQFGFDIKDEDISMYQGERLYMYRGGGGGAVLGLIFAGYVPMASQSAYPIIVNSLWPIIDLTLVTFGQICNFRDPDLVTFYFCVYHINRLNRLFQNELTNIE